MFLENLGITDVGAGNEVQSVEDVIMPDNSKLSQHIWISGKGYHRYVPINNGNPDWSRAEKWNAALSDGRPIPLANFNLPISNAKKVQANSGYLSVDRSRYTSTFWVDGKVFMTTTPVINGKIEWENTDKWQGYLDSGSLYLDCK